MKKSAIKKAIDEQHVQQLLALFPRGDPEYFQTCLEHYHENPVERIAEKITTHLGGYYPQIPIPQQPHDNRLNACLRILALDLFPDCDIGYLRDLVLTFSNAHIEQAVNTLVSVGKWPERLEYGKMKIEDGIRSDRYKKQAQLQLIQDYPQIWKSSIRAVLAENNWDYIKSHDQLKEMGSGGFWNTVRNFFMHWSMPSSSSSSHQEERLTITDYHLLQQLKELVQRSIDQQIENDLTVAHSINLLEYEQQDQCITCDCCFGDFTFEQLAFCSEGTHSFCHSCIIRYISEGLFGQGALRGQSRIACISSTDDCQGCFLPSLLQTVLSNDIWMAYENSLLDSIKNHRIQCCQCSYFELDESIKPLDTIYANTLVSWIAKWIMVVELFLLIIITSTRGFGLAFFINILFLSLQYISFHQWDKKSDLELAYQRISKSRRGNAFQCRNNECKTVTCLNCQRPIRGMHTCYEKESDGLRLYVEKAMADAVKRTCPNCSLSFQKSDGCNKIVCKCGYTMCYVCRKDIGKESYAHFCDHFRERPGTKCTRCKKCDLYKTAPDDEAVQLAAVKAKQQYLKAHPEVSAVVAPHTVIGPKNTLDKLEEMRQDVVLWCLERGLEYIV